jgi:hypothetical protein
MPTPLRRGLLAPVSPAARQPSPSPKGIHAHQSHCVASRSGSELPRARKHYGEDDPPAWRRWLPGSSSSSSSSHSSSPALPAKRKAGDNMLASYSPTPSGGGALQHKAAERQPSAPRARELTEVSLIQGVADLSRLSLESRRRNQQRPSQQPREPAQSPVPGKLSEKVGEPG